MLFGHRILQIRKAISVVAMPAFTCHTGVPEGVAAVWALPLDQPSCDADSRRHHQLV